MLVACRLAHTMQGSKGGRNAGRGWRICPPKPRRIGGIWGERTRRPPAQILGHIGRGASHDAGRSRVSVRRAVQALSGFVVRQRPRVDSRAVIPSLAWHRPQSRVTKRRRYGRPVLEDLAADDPHRQHRAAAYPRHPLDAAPGRASVARHLVRTANASSTSRRPSSTVRRPCTSPARATATSSCG